MCGGYGGVQMSRPSRALLVGAFSLLIADHGAATSGDRGTARRRRRAPLVVARHLCICLVFIHGLIVLGQPKEI
jgi:hypothetical protein